MRNVGWKPPVTYPGYTPELSATQTLLQKEAFDYLTWIKTLLCHSTHAPLPTYDGIGV